MDAKIEGGLLEGAVTTRRNLLTGAGAAMMAVAATGGLALLSSKSANASISTDGWYDLKKDFFAAGDGVQDDTTAWEQAISAGSANVRPIFVPPGAYRITRSLHLPSNTMIIGSNLGLGFGCRLEPFGCAAFDVGGATQSFHCSVENLMIWPNGTAPDHIISIDNSYSVRFSNIRIHEAQSELTRATIVLLGDIAVGGHGACNNIIWENVIVRNDSTFPKIAILAEAGCGTHRFITPDVERAETLFDWRGGQLDIINAYTERAGKYALNCYVAATDTTAYLNTYGGFFIGAASSVTCAIQTTTRNFNSFGTQWLSPNHAVYVYGLPSAAVNFHGMVPNVSGIGESRIAGLNGWQNALNFPDYTLSNSKSWSVTVPGRDQVTTTITIVGVQVGTHWARASMNGNLAGVQLSAYVSADDTVTVVAQYNRSNPVSLNGSLRVTCGWG